MARDIDLTSPQWTDLVFEGKNKEYGAYEMRNDSSDRHLKALIIITIVGLAAVYLPNLIKEPEAPKPEAVSQTTEVEFGKFVDPASVPKTLPAVAAPKPATVPAMPVKEIRFVTPTVVPDVDVIELGMPTQDVLGDFNGLIGSVTKDGIPGSRPVETLPVESETTKEPPVFVHVEQMPQPVGGLNELMKWLGSNLRYPSMAAESNIQGKVVVRFVVRPNGSIDDVSVVKSLEPGCDKEAVRVVKKMQNWIPGKQNGNPVSVYYTLPIQFKLQNQ